MAYDPLKHHRRSTRLRGFDYASPGAYFVTVCVHKGIAAFGQLADEGFVRHNWCGQIVLQQWNALPTKFPHLVLDECVVMPNHFHALLWFASYEEHPAPRATLGAVMGFWKFQTTRLINEARQDRWCQGAAQIWQRGFYDRIVRTEREIEFVRRYIQENPRRASNP